MLDAPRGDVASRTTKNREVGKGTADRVHGPLPKEQLSKEDLRWAHIGGRGAAPPRPLTLKVERRSETQRSLDRNQELLFLRVNSSVVECDPSKVLTRVRFPFDANFVTRLKPLFIVRVNIWGLFIKLLIK